MTGANATVGGKTTPLWSGGSDDIQAYGSRDSSLPVLLDTGSTAWSIPYTYYNAIVRLFDYVSPQQGVASCSHANSGDSLDLEFGGKVKIHVDVSQFLVPIINSTTRKPIPLNSRGDEACAFLLQPSQQSEMAFEVLGDAILRSMYVVFDLDNAQVSIAQAAQNSSAKPDIVTVQAGPTGVAEAVGGSSVQTAASNTFSAAGQLSATSYTVSTAASTIGTATGEAAVPADAQVLESGSSGSGGGSGSGSGGNGGSTSSGAASGIVIPSADFTPVWITGLWIAGIALGFGVMM